MRSPPPPAPDGRAAEVYANLAGRILLAQVKDARRHPASRGAQGDDWQLVLLGEGEVPVRQMLELLAAGGCRHWISVERENRCHPEIPSARSRCRSTWRCWPSGWR